MQMAGFVADSVPTILDLNEDCWRAVLDYVPVQDIIRSERTSRRWRELVLTYLRSVTARGVAALCGNAGARLLRLDLQWSLRLTEDDVVAIVSSCRNLETLKLDGCYGLCGPALLARAAAARRGRTPLHLAADFAALHNQEYKELVYHNKWSGITCAKCA